MTRDIAQIKASLAGKIGWREFTFVRESLNEDDRTVEIAFSSEAAIVPRWFGGEILSHDPAHIRLERFQSDAPLLDNHNSRQQIGIILGDTVTLGADRILRARVKFDINGYGLEIFEKVKDGTRKKASIGYLVHNLILHSRSGDDEIYLVTDWEPYEGSLVSIAADISVGVGRAADITPDPIPAPVNPTPTPTTEVRTMTPETNPAGNAAPVTAPAVVVSANATRMAEENELIEFGKMHNELEMAREFALTNKSLAELRQAIIAKRAAAQTAIPQATPATTLGLTDKEKREFSLVRLMRSAADQNPDLAGYEREVCAEVAKRQKREMEPGRFSIPYDIQTYQRSHLTTSEREVLSAAILGQFGQRGLDTLTAAAGGALVAKNLLAGSFLDLLVANSVVISGGANFLTGLVGDIDIPRLTAEGEPSFKGEKVDSDEIAMTTGTLTMKPKELRGFVDFSRKLLVQSTPSIDQLVNVMFARRHALKIDKAAITSVPTADTPTGFTKATGVTPLNTGGSPVAFNHAQSRAVVAAVMTGNADPSTCKWFLAPTIWATLGARAKDGTNNGFMIDDMNNMVGLPVIPTTQYRKANGTIEDTEIALADVSKVFIGEWGQFDIFVDLSVKARSGEVRVYSYQFVDTNLSYSEYVKVWQQFS